MQDLLCEMSPRGSQRRKGWGLTILATVLLSFGVGAATAAFTLMSAEATHGAPYAACDTIRQLSGSPFTHERHDFVSADAVQARVTETYRATYESSYQMHYQVRYEDAGELASSWSDMTDDLDVRSLAPLFAAGALAMLVACARAAAGMLAVPHAPAVTAISAVGALFVSAILISVLGLPAMGLRAVAFAICVSLLAARFARMSRNDQLPAA